MGCPTVVGWYGIRMPHPSGAHVLRTLYCFPGERGLVCEEGGEFFPVTHARYAGGEWFGPYTLRVQADEALKALKDTKRPSP